VFRMLQFEVREVKEIQDQEGIEEGKGIKNL
jgi:hypothetical protein